MEKPFLPQTPTYIHDYTCMLCICLYIYIYVYHYICMIIYACMYDICVSDRLWVFAILGFGLTKDGPHVWHLSSVVVLVGRHLRTSVFVSKKQTQKIQWKTISSKKWWALFIIFFKTLTISVRKLKPFGVSIHKAPTKRRLWTQNRSWVGRIRCLSKLLKIWEPLGSHILSCFFSRKTLFFNANDRSSWSLVHILDWAWQSLKEDTICVCYDTLHIHLTFVNYRHIIPSNLT